MKRPREGRIWKNRSLDTRDSSSWNGDDEDGGRNRDPIPLDLTLEILARLPVKSLTRFRSVSKLWASIIHGRDFINSFVVNPWNQPRLLFVFQYCKKWFIFSSPQNMNMEEISSSRATFHMSCPEDRPWFPHSGSVYGLICCGLPPSFVVLNPSTGQSIRLPKVKSRRLGIKKYLGYDPIVHQHKVLCMSVCLSNRWGESFVAGEFQVLTLGARKLSWRMIECSVPHYPEKDHYCSEYDGICINGVVYYQARSQKYNGISMIMSFDVGSEKFSFIKPPEGIDFHLFHLILINYKGKLAKICCGSDIDLWVLEDAEKHEWSRKIHVPSPSWGYPIRKSIKYHIVTVNDEGEIVFAPRYLNHPLRVIYYNLERNTVRKVEIKGIAGDEFRLQDQDKSRRFNLTTLANHTESMMPL
ncbi:PREDICTED: F-box protein DOR-like [Tarenaya hassleriana]|uniref:F-box protein DOR-like n=1 Tax=Tarenaya hassleriana TaxID=28532 RepID=UPI00053C21CE|nr:PREDICTED: F-box protein DOR-like [Tarenaya hassleriana]